MSDVYVPSSGTDRRVLNNGSAETVASVVSPFSLMTEVLVKLRILNYLEEFPARDSFPAVHQYSFSIPQKNTSDQFFHFASLSAWLLSKLNVDMPLPTQFDDPEFVAGDIRRHVARVFESITVQYPDLLSQFKNVSPNKFSVPSLRKGNGENVCWILNFLCDVLISQQDNLIGRPSHWTYQSLTDTEEDEDDEYLVDSSYEIDDELVVKAQQSVLTVNETERAVSRKSAKPPIDEPEDIVYEEWLAQVARVAPQLASSPHSRMTWQNQLTALAHHVKTLSEESDAIIRNATRLKHQVTKDLEKIENREQFLGQQLEQTVSVHSTVDKELRKVEQEHNELREHLENSENELIDVETRLEMIKESMDERGSSVKDTGPVKRMRQAIKDLKKEIKDLRIQQTVLHTLWISDLLQSS
ncbi:hypothetical protein PCE1_000963 [Barthelona sp. PCE]